ncbi:thioesterase [Nocardioides marmoriginsengisoli]|uniref:Thioesterase n=1 Tax=Nocardioides marmoriginsengisoli TaxID=661483 RepID=A0A3N0CHL6_9ACTN|nr:thioesterase family protein [Nocardioides marmoriginsengisoli]RNL62769.1 thioesterase [Nocardioides marmoriginsengisoli]
MPLNVPSFDQVLETAHALTLVVPPEFEDLNGHMNIRHYVATHDEAAVALFNEIGFDPAYVKDRSRYFFDLEHHLGYHSEVFIGDEISVYLRFVGRTHKVIHYVAFVVDHRTRLVANTMEVATAHVDLATRRTVPFANEDVRQLDRLIAAHQELDWAVPLSGSMNLSRPVSP